MFHQNSNASLGVVFAALFAAGCSGGKTSDQPPPVEPHYAQPPPSPFAQADVAKDLRTYFAEGALSSDGSGGSSGSGAYSSPIWKSKASEEMYLMHNVAISEGWRETCEDAVGRYLADLAKKCGDLAGEMKIGEVERNDTGFRVTSTYTLPPAEGSEGRAGTVEIELKDHPEERRKMVSVLINEEARGKQLPFD